MKGEEYLKKESVIKMSTVKLVTVTIAASAVSSCPIFNSSVYLSDSLFSDESIWISEFAFFTQESSRTTKRSYWSLQQPTIWYYRYYISGGLDWKGADRQYLV